MGSNVFSYSMPAPNNFGSQIGDLMTAAKGIYNKRQVDNALAGFNGNYEEAANTLIRMGHIDEATKLLAAGGHGGLFGNVYWDDQGRAFGIDRQKGLVPLNANIQPPVKPVNLGDTEKYIGPGGSSYGQDLKSGPVPTGYTQTSPGVYEGMPNTPEGQSSPSMAKGRMSQAIGTLTSATNELYKNGGVSVPGGSAVSNLEAYAANSHLGQKFGEALGTKNQSLRSTINNTIPLVMSDLANAAGLKAQQLNSNVELSFYRNAIGNPQGDIVSRLAAVDALDRMYGTGNSLETSGLDPELLKQVHQRADIMSTAHPMPDISKLKQPERLGPPDQAPGVRSVPTFDVSPAGEVTPTNQSAPDYGYQPLNAPAVSGATQLIQGPGAVPRIAKGSAAEIKLLKWANEAIQKGADPNAVATRLRALGVAE